LTHFNCYSLHECWLIFRVIQFTVMALSAKMEVGWEYRRQQNPCTNFYSVFMNYLFTDSEWVHVLCQFTPAIRTAFSEIRLKLWVLPSCMHQDVDRSLDVIS